MTNITLRNVRIPDGYEATSEYRLPKKGEWYIAGDDLALQAGVNHYGEDIQQIILRKLPKPERMVAVMLSESYLLWLVTPGRTGVLPEHFKLLCEAARKALAQEPHDWQDDYTQQEVCGVEICSGDRKRWVEHKLTFLGMSDHVADARCCLPKGHTQEHSPEPAT